MARKWTGRLVAIAVLIGGAYAGLVRFDPGGAAVEANARQASVAPVPLPDPVPRPLELAAIEVVEVAPAQMAERLRVSGELRPVNRVVLRSKAAGTVLEVKVRAGQSVEAGDVLVRFETQDLQAALAQHTSNMEGARAELLQAERTRGRVEELARRNISSAEQLDRALSDVSAARAKVQGLSAQIDIARSALANAEIRAPFDGVVSHRAVDPGAATAANADLLTLVDVSVLEAEMLVSTRDVARLRVGHTAELEIDGLEGGTVAGTVDRINPVANEGSRFVPVFVRLANPQGRLWGGMFATGSILVRQSRDALVLPATSLREDEGGAFVLKLEEGRLVRQAVAVRARWDGGARLEVEGVLAGDVVVTAPLPELRPGAAAILARAG
ncbi:efflux RND transporter periplasmic adaptor subunit [Aureimonas populi]|uniref:Efflux RND transporter periplasmic adaptor subunit n=1 Tax=Aureimonas populi TaxID=1701758 RepID=A0ABW5CQN6_9HYPH|nr:efflux RND transporter periplasmic adaptor subunit [Aureimonas populi]